MSQSVLYFYSSSLLNQSFWTVFMELTLFHNLYHYSRTRIANLLTRSMINFSLEEKLLDLHKKISKRKKTYFLVEVKTCWNHYCWLLIYLLIASKNLTAPSLSYFVKYISFQKSLFIKHFSDGINFVINIVA